MSPFGGRRRRVAMALVLDCQRHSSLSTPQSPSSVRCHINRIRKPLRRKLSRDLLLNIRQKCVIFRTACMCAAVGSLGGGDAQVQPATFTFLFFYGERIICVHLMELLHGTYTLRVLLHSAAFIAPRPFVFVCMICHLARNRCTARS